MNYIQHMKISNICPGKEAKWNGTDKTDYLNFHVLGELEKKKWEHSGKSFKLEDFV